MIAVAEEYIAGAVGPTYVVAETDAGWELACEVELDNGTVVTLLSNWSEIARFRREQVPMRIVDGDFLATYQPVVSTEGSFPNAKVIDPITWEYEEPASEELTKMVVQQPLEGLAVVASDSTYRYTKSVGPIEWEYSDA